MRVLVTWGSKPGGTEGIARSVAEGLRQGGIDAMLEPASAVRGLRGYGAAVIANHSPVAFAFTAIVALLDAGVVAALILRSFAMFASFAGTWLPFILVFLATWTTGTVMTMIPARGAPQAVARS